MKRMPGDMDSVDTYISGFEPAVQARLKKIRATIRRAVPAAVESISYRMPAYKLDGPLLYFAAFKNHIGMYPITGPLRTEFQEELAAFKGGKGTVQFPHDQPIPLRLIARMARFRAEENRNKVLARRPAKRPRAPVKTKSTTVRSRRA